MERSSGKPKGVKLADLVDAGLLSVGARLVPTAKAHSTVDGTVTVNGSIRIGAIDHQSPSTAAEAVTGKATNGWRFWRLADGGFAVTLDFLRDAYLARQAD